MGIGDYFQRIGGCAVGNHLGVNHPMNTYQLYWAPEGKLIATVRAKTMRAAIRKAPYPYRRYLGEIYAIERTVPPYFQTVRP